MTGYLAKKARVAMIALVVFGIVYLVAVFGMHDLLVKMFAILYLLAASLFLIFAILWFLKTGLEIMKEENDD